MLPSVLQFFALPSSNKVILWCSSTCTTFLSMQSRLEDSLADLVFSDLEGRVWGVEVILSRLLVTFAFLSLILIYTIKLFILIFMLSRMMGILIPLESGWKSRYLGWLCRLIQI